MVPGTARFVVDRFNNFRGGSADFGRIVRWLVDRRRGNLGFICLRSRNPFFMHVFARIERAARRVFGGGDRKWLFLLAKPGGVDVVFFIVVVHGVVYRRDTHGQHDTYQQAKQSRYYGQDNPARRGAQHAIQEKSFGQCLMDALGHYKQAKPHQQRKP